jgi:SagB-type dehydrogenase family enzyme
MKLPEPRKDGSLEGALAERRSIRSFDPEPLSAKQLSQLLWSGQGVTSSNGYRTAPTAGGTLPLELHLLTADGVFRYDPPGHALKLLADEDRRPALAAACLGQGFISQAPAVFVIAGLVERTARIYGQRAGRYVALEAGCASQSIMLQAVALGLGSVMVGAYDDRNVSRLAELPAPAIPYAVIPVGRPG